MKLDDGRYMCTGCGTIYKGYMGYFDKCIYPSFTFWEKVKFWTREVLESLFWAFMTSFVCAYAFFYYGYTWMRNKA